MGSMKIDECLSYKHAFYMRLGMEILSEIKDVAAIIIFVAYFRA